MENYQLESFNALVSRVVDEVIPTLDPTVVDEEVTANQEEYSDAEKAKIPENPGLFLLYECEKKCLRQKILHLRSDIL